MTMKEAQRPAARGVNHRGEHDRGGGGMTADAMARARVAATLAAIEAAQTEIDQAVQALSAVRGFMPQYERLGKIYETVRAVWHAVEQRRQALGERIKLDHDESTAYEIARWGHGGRRATLD